MHDRALAYLHRRECTGKTTAESNHMINHDVMEKRPERDDLSAKMAAWEMENGPVTTEPIRVRDDGGRMIIPNAETLSAARKRGALPAADTVRYDSTLAAETVSNDGRTDVCCNRESDLYAPLPPGRWGVFLCTIKSPALIRAAGLLLSVRGVVGQAVNFMVASSGKVKGEPRLKGTSIYQAGMLFTTPPGRCCIIETPQRVVHPFLPRSVITCGWPRWPRREAPPVNDQPGAHVVETPRRLHRLGVLADTLPLHCARSPARISWQAISCARWCAIPPFSAK